MSSSELIHWEKFRAVYNGVNQAVLKRNSSLSSGSVYFDTRDLDELLTGRYSGTKDSTEDYWPSEDSVCTHCTHLYVRGVYTDLHGPAPAAGRPRFRIARSTHPALMGAAVMRRSNIGWTSGRRRRRRPDVHPMFDRDPSATDPGSMSWSPQRYFHLAFKVSGTPVTSHRLLPGLTAVTADETLADAGPTTAQRLAYWSAFSRSRAGVCCGPEWKMSSTFVIFTSWLLSLEIAV